MKFLQQCLLIQVNVSFICVSLNEKEEKNQVGGEDNHNGENKPKRTGTKRGGEGTEGKRKTQEGTKKDKKKKGKNSCGQIRRHGAFGCFCRAHAQKKFGA